ncbi:MAG: RraA family protein [Acidobacteria bacterium]|nr:RraA family protein [Acidobacteriota bacterium]
MKKSLTYEQLETLGRLDTCTVSNVIETFDVRLRSEGFADSGIRCMFPNLPPVVGYAATGKIRCSGPPPVGHTYFDRTDWWNYLITIPPPRIVVVEDVDSKVGQGAFVGEVHVNILLALGCVGLVTNGAVRDLGAVERLGFRFFAGHLAVSHSYVHMVEFGTPVEIGGLQVEPGDLLHGDRHGVLSVPQEIAPDIPSKAAEMLDDERRVIELCRSEKFSIEKLRETVERMG